MRDFRITPEPRGNKLSPKKTELRYYIQRHDASRLHYDFRLEIEGVLKSWAVPKGPKLGSQRAPARGADGAGDVLLWDKGRWIPEDADPVEALRKGRLLSLKPPLRA